MSNPESKPADERAIQLPGAKAAPEFDERLVVINRCSKTVKGGRNLSFSALVVCGNHKGSFGVGFGKANEVSDAIRKASSNARSQAKTIRIPLHGKTVPHDVVGQYCGAHVIIKPATEGTGMIAGGGMRAVLELAGVRDVLCKSLGATSPMNVVKATAQALQSLESRDSVLAKRGLK